MRNGQGGWSGQVPPTPRISETRAQKAKFFAIFLSEGAPGRAALPSRGRRLALRHQGAPRSNRGMICRHGGVEGCPAFFLRVTYQTREGGSHGYDLAQMNILLLGLGGPIVGAQPAEKPEWRES